MILTPRQVTRQRRAAAARRTWRLFRANRSGMFGLVLLSFFVLVAVFAPLLADAEGLQVTKATGEVLEAPSAAYPLGTDDTGRSVLTLLIWGSRISLFVGLAAAFISMALGTIIGMWAGYKSSVHDAILMRITDVFLVLPWLALAIVLAAMFGQNFWIIIIIIGLTSWAGTARLVRAQVLSVKERTYIERSRALGASDAHVVLKHITPNLMPIIFANTILTIAIAILSESQLSFLGLGDPNAKSWGTLIEEAFNHGALTLHAWWWLMAPSISIVLVVLGFTMVGFAMDEIVNPRIRER